MRKEAGRGSRLHWCYIQGRLSQGAMLSRMARAGSQRNQRALADGWRLAAVGRLRLRHRMRKVAGAERTKSAGGAGQRHQWATRGANYVFPGQRRLVKSLLSLYIDGQRAAEDFAQGAQWFQKAADQGSPDAQFGLGLLYAAGQGIGQSYPDAYYWRPRFKLRRQRHAMTLPRTLLPTSCRARSSARTNG